MCISNPAFDVSKTHITCLRIERGVQVYLNEGLSRFPIVDNSDIVKLYQRFFSKHVQMKGYVLFFHVEIIATLNQLANILFALFKRVNCQDMFFFQVSHRPSLTILNTLIN